MARKKQEASATSLSPEEALPASYTSGAGLEALGPDDFIIPRLTLVQPSSQIEGVPAGRFHMNLTGEEFDEVQAVFLKVTKGRVFFLSPDERKPTCGSLDRIKPSLRYTPPQAAACKECARARWNGNEPAECNDTYNLLGVMVETKLPFWWSVKSTAMTPTKRLLSAIALRARLGKNLYDAHVVIKSQLVTLPGKKYHVPVYNMTWLSDSREYQSLYEQYAHEEIERTFMAEEAAEGNGEDRQDFDWERGQTVS